MYNPKHRLIVAAVFLAFMSSLVLHANIPQSQREALIALYNATNGDSWTYKTGWKDGDLHTDGFALPGTEGTWYGVTVDADNVTSIGLSANYLVGTIPVALGDLTGLQVLSLGNSWQASPNNNQLSGSIPAELGNLVNLQQLYLSYTQISGPIPASLGNLAVLQGLYLDNNQLNGPIPASLGNMTSLQYLYLSGNPLGGSIPSSLGNLANLRSLYLVGCAITGPIPASLGALAELRELMIYNNQFSDSIPPQLGNLTNLGRFWAASNQLTGPIPASLGGMTALYDLQFGGNQLSGSIPAELGSLTNLTSLSLGGNQLTGSIPAELGNLAKLIGLGLGSNLLSGPIPAELGNLTNLTSLSLYSNDLTGQIPAALSSLTKLTNLDLRYNHLTGTIPAALGSLTGLRYLYLNANVLSGPIPAALMNLTLLSYTDIGYNALYSTDPTLTTFLNAKDADWAVTQTIAPTGVTAEAIDGAAVRVSWTPIAFTGFNGYYKIYHDQSAGGPYGLAGQTANKSATSFDVPGLNQGQPYYFVVQTHSDPHQYNYYKNHVESEYSAEVTATPWIQVDIRVTGTVTAGGSPLANVVMSGLPGNPVTDPLGVYDTTVDAGWSGTVTPTLDGYTFAPVSRTYSVLQDDQLSQDYAATPLVRTITVTAPNGGESWRAGTTHDVTWGQSNLSGTATVDLYKGGVYQKTLETVDVTEGVFSWVIAGNEAVGTDFRIVVWLGGTSDESDGDFSIVPGRKDDLVCTWDGQGTYYRNSDTGAWVMLASPATLITAWDLDVDGIDDLIGLWPSQGGVWVRYSDGTWVRIASTASYIGAGDMNGDGRVDLVGNWDGQGVYYRSSLNGEWVRMASEATMVTTGDLDGDGTDDLIGLWPAQGGIWVKYSSTGAWARLASTAVHIGAGDMNADGRDDLLGTWDGQGVYYRDSISGTWVRMASPATLITTGDLDGDATDDLIGIWPTQGGVWAKYSRTGAWALLGATARDIAAGKMRPAPMPAPPEAGEAQVAAQDEALVEGAVELPLPMGRDEQGPGLAQNKRDISDRGPGGAMFVYLEEKNLVPTADRTAELTRIPGPGEPGFVAGEQKNVHPGEVIREDRERSRENKDKKKDKR